MPEVIASYVLEHAPVLAAVGFAVWFMARHEARASKLADAIDRLTQGVEKVTTTLEHLHDRVNAHDTEIALLKKRD